MARQIGKLTALTVSKAKRKGQYPDGGNLYLQVVESGAKSWLFRYMLNGKTRTMGLGAVHAVSLAEARDKATAYRNILAAGGDPMEAKKTERTQAQLEAARSKTFKQCATAYIDAHKAGWRNAKHAGQWDTSLDTYVYPMFGHLPVQDIDVTLVMKALEQKLDRYEGKIFWEATPETANRVRNRIESILNWATAREYRRGENPARWRGHLENLLPRRSHLKGVKHHAALPYEEVGDFLISLKQQTGIGVDAFEFVILTAARTGEVTGARWDEFDLQKKVWVVPAHRIKAGREHRVPLSAAALSVLKRRDKPKNPDDLVFPGPNKSKPLSKMGLISLLRRMKRTDITVHGFRSCFRDWAAEQTNFPREVAESALAHANADKVEAAYRRSDLFEKRRRMMDAWARYCATPSVKKKTGIVVNIKG
ncbi:MAG: integrase arm-type DNA-binding domain-containing protein [Pseudomonadota bacterium]|nr:integrase arm-type DNA-binding domain-containing protein [Pseudomonadota bacterium]MDE3037094.1 integrase arm-type DNA-binding domain-containing protein [Pseudomonadota bacterium]